MSYQGYNFIVKGGSYSNFIVKGGSYSNFIVKGGSYSNFIVKGGSYSNFILISKIRSFNFCSCTKLTFYIKKTCIFLEIDVFFQQVIAIDVSSFANNLFFLFKTNIVAISCEAISINFTSVNIFHACVRSTFFCLSI